MNEELLYAIFMLILILASVAYFYIKDKESAHKILRLEKAIEDINKTLHYLRKALDDKPGVDFTIDTDALKNEIKLSLEREINSKILPILKSLQGFENVIEEFQNEQENRLANLEQKAQNISKLSPDTAIDEQKIIELFRQGKSVAQIAKDLRISTGNVEFTLKMKELM